VVDLVQDGAKGPIENPRLILLPIWHDRMGELETATDLPARLKAEIEQFFLSATFFTEKPGGLMAQMLAALCSFESWCCEKVRGIYEPRAHRA
jgi:hypothetical protein